MTEREHLAQETPFGQRYSPSGNSLGHLFECTIPVDDCRLWLNGQWTHLVEPSSRQSGLVRKLTTVGVLPGSWSRRVGSKRIKGLDIFDVLQYLHITKFDDLNFY